MVAILLLAVAIIPMVGMFDAGLRAATQGSDYDKARALANKQLETAKNLPYQDARDSFPVDSSTPDAATGVYESSDQNDADFLILRTGYAKPTLGWEQRILSRTRAPGL